MAVLADLLQLVKSLAESAGISYKDELVLSDVLALIALAITLFGLAWAITKYVVVAPVKFIHNNFTSPEIERKQLIEFLSKAGTTKKYQKLVQRLLNGLQQFYGKANSSKAFTRSFSIAYIYPILLFLLAYAFFLGSSEFAGFKLFPEAESGRLLVLLSTVFITVVMVVIFIAGDWLDEKARKPFNKWLKNPKTADVVYRLSMMMLTVLFAMSYNSDWKYLLFIAGMGYWLGAFAGAFAGSVVVSVAAISAFFGNYTASLTVIVFFLVFPLLNALLDWLSLRVSRYFLEEVKKENNPFWIFTDIVLDLILAIGFMLALVIILLGVVEWFNAFYALFDAKAVLDWRALVEDALQDPFGKGLMVTSMLITTLIPTLVHVFIGLYAFSINSLFGKQLAKYLKDPNPHRLRPWIAAIWIEAYGFFVLFLLAGLVYLFWTVFQFPVGQWLYAIAEWGHDKTWLVIVILLSLLFMGFYKHGFWRKS